MEQVSDPEFPLCDIQSSHVKNLVASARLLALDYRTWIITAMWFADLNPTGTYMKDAIAGKGGQRVVKEGFELILLSKRYCCIVVRQLNTEDGGEWSKRPLQTTHTICQDGQAI